MHGPLLTLYCAFSAPIATAAVRAQHLAASSDFSLTRMTWIKPSWCWMMYRSGYATKDACQTNVLALKLKASTLLDEILPHVIVAGSQDPISATEKAGRVRVQWDPERTPSLQRLPHRSIQIGIPRELMQTFVDDWVVEIEDVTERARLMKRAVDEGNEEEIRWLMPEETVLDLPDRVRAILGIEQDEEHKPLLGYPESK